jgi:hypothetical protein
MKIAIAGKQELISSVEVSVDEDAHQMHLLINTRDRWMPHQLSGGWNLFDALLPRDVAPPSYRLVAISESDSFESGVEVVFLPENEEEEELLFGFAYSQTEKDQVTYLIVPLRQSVRSKTLVRLAV